MSEPVRLPTVAFGSTREAASELSVAAKAAKAGPFFVFPFNKYEPDDSIWWLSPKGESALNPAYEFGKIAVAPRDLASPGSFFIGFEVEKGVEGPAAREMFGVTGHGRRMIMESTWTWHQFMKGMSDGRVAERASESEALGNGPLTVEVIHAPQTPPINELDQPRVRDTDADIVRFEFSSGSLTKIDESLPLGRLTGLSAVRTLDALAEKIETVPERDWAWTEVLVGRRYASAADGAAGRSANEVWKETCQSWKQWLR